MIGDAGRGGLRHVTMIEKEAQKTLKKENVGPWSLLCHFAHLMY